MEKRDALGMVSKGDKTGIKRGSRECWGVWGGLWGYTVASRASPGMEP